MLRKFLITLIIFLSLIFLVALFLPRVIDLDQYKPALVLMVEKRVNGKVNLRHIELTILDELGVRLHGFEILNTNGRFDNSTFLRTERLEVKIGLLPLLAGKINVKLILEAPQILLEKDREGIFSFKRMIGEPESPTIPADSQTQSGVSSWIDEFIITALNIKNGKITYIDHTLYPLEPKALTLEDLHLKVDNLSHAKPVIFKLALGEEVSASGGIRLEGKARIDTEHDRIDLQDTDLTLGSLKLELSGKVNDYKVHPVLDLDFSSSQFDLAKLFSLYPPVARKIPPGLSLSGLSSLKGSINGEIGNLLIRSSMECGESTISYGESFKKTKGVPASLALSLLIEKGSIMIDDIELDLATLRLKGSGRVNNIREPRIELRAAANEFGLKGWEEMLPSLRLSKLTGSVRISIAAEGVIKEQEKLSYKGIILLNDVGGSVPGLNQEIKGLKGELGFSSDSVFSRALALKLGNSDINLVFELNDFENPVVSFDLSSEMLVLDELLRSLEKEGGEEGGAALETESSKGMDLLNRVDIRGTIRVEQGKLRNLNFENLNLSLTINKKLVNLSDLSFDLYGGTYQGTGKLDMGEQEPTYIFQSRINEVRIHEILSRFPSLEGLLSGLLFADLSLSGKGVNFESFSKSLSGNGKVSLSRGGISKISLGESLSDLSRLKGWENESTGTSFDTMESQVAISEGRVNTTDLRLNTNDMNITANGYFDRSRRINYQARAVLSRRLSQRLEGGNGGEFFKDESDRIIIPFRLEGTVDNPGFTLDREALDKGQRERALRKTEEELNRAINKDLNR